MKRSQRILICIVALWISHFTLFESKNSLISKGNELIQKGDFKGALEKYNKAAKEIPDQPGIHYNKGVAYYHLKDYKSAKKAFQRALEGSDKPLKAKAYYNLGNAAFRLNEFKEAYQYFIQALKLDPANKAIKYNLELALIKYDPPCRSIEDKFSPNHTFEEAKEVKPGTYPNLRFCKGFEDYFKVSVKKGGDLYAQLKMDPQKGALDLEAYSPDKTLLKKSLGPKKEKNIAFEKNERDDSFILKVFGINGAENKDYTLTISDKKPEKKDDKKDKKKDDPKKDQKDKKDKKDKKDPKKPDPPKKEEPKKQPEKKPKKVERQNPDDVLDSLKNKEKNLQLQKMRIPAREVEKDW